MKVSELIEKLKLMPSEVEVYIIKEDYSKLDIVGINSKLNDSIFIDHVGIHVI